MLKIVTVGACAGDYVGISLKRILKSDSNPGVVRLSSGGVARNIAEDLFRLGADVLLISFAGSDRTGEFLAKELKDLGISHKLLIKDKERSCCYLAIHDHDGNLECGINDFSIFDTIGAKDFAPCLPDLDKADMIVLDCNLSHEALTYLIKRYKDKRIFIDGVSQAKIGRLSGLLEDIFLLKANMGELAALSGIDTKDDFAPAIDILFQKGLQNILLTSGSGPIRLVGKDGIISINPQSPEKIVSTTGAGDALYAGLIRGLSLGLSKEKSLELGNRAACIVMACAAASSFLLSTDIIDM
ncbi:MAG TPA: PfkB family carbohydrate kinase [Bacillota bacterium]|nr:PfkB family carbohydrate kinase [Bacillota bacterium]HPJ85732.1 PfkB family carbohydrate kinase [Bacillota bacterium]HPQ61631.1 PfkB family carbohydrate kinase [Bacillota bacterium]HRX91538.1 PfkB family carbohydrate kinase [Candidatus Izemoplasmatales bacterium]